MRQAVPAVRVERIGPDLAFQAEDGLAFARARLRMGLYGGGECGHGRAAGRLAYDGGAARACPVASQWPCAVFASKSTSHVPRLDDRLAVPVRASIMLQSRGSMAQDRPDGFIARLPVLWRQPDRPPRWTGGALASRD